MLKKIPSSVRTAFFIASFVVLYFALSTIFRSDTTISEEAIELPMTRVVTSSIQPLSQNSFIEVRGRTKATRISTLRAETVGQVEATPATEGSFVKEGTEICRITPGTRNAGLAEARAAVEKARIDYNAAVKLAQEGYQSDAAVAAARAAYDLSEANLTRARADFAKTRIKAPFDGVLTERHVEVGDLLTIGSSCATVAQLDPIIISGAVSEQEVTRIRSGATAIVQISNGDTLEAAVTQVSPAASNSTRTFLIELQADNPNMLLDGLTANARINIGLADAHLVPRNSLIRDDAGELGVRVVKNIDPVTGTGTVDFLPASILADDPEGIWISGLSGNVNLIVRGQDYVKRGQDVVTAEPGETLRTG